MAANQRIEHPPFVLEGLDHVVLRVPDMARAVAFYTGVLGATEERRADTLGLVQLRAGAALIDLLDLAMPWFKDAAPSPTGFNVDHICIRVEPFDQSEIERYLTARGVDVHDRGQRFGAEGTGPSVYIRDPFGNVVELKGPPTPIGATEPVLKTARLALRPIRMTDAEALLPVFQDPQSMLYWAHPPLKSIAEMRERVANNMVPQSRPGFSFAITEDGERALGWINFYGERNAVAGLGYILAPEHRGKGYVSEAVRAMLRHGFTSLRLHRIYLDIDPRNAASIAVAERTGFHREGLARKAFFMDGDYFDTVYYAMLYEDWLARAG